MPKPTGAQILGALLKAGGRGLGQYYDLKQYEEQKKLQEKDREWIETVRGWRKEDRQRDIAQAKREQEVKQRAQSFLKILGRGSPFAPEIPDAGLQQQKAYDILGRTAPEDVQMKAKAEGYARYGLTPDEIKGKLGIAPKAPKTPREKEEEALWQTLTSKQKIQKLFGIKPPDTDKETAERQKELEKAQTRWDKDVRNHILRNADLYPKTADLITETGRFSIGYKLKPEGWSNKDWNRYKFEQVRIRRFMGTRPETPTSVPADLQDFFE